MSKSSIITGDRATLLTGLAPVHPGEILEDEIVELGISASQLARAIDVPCNRVTEICRRQRGISADTALRLAYFFGTSAHFWLNLQQSYDLAVTEQERGEEIANRVRPHAV